MPGEPVAETCNGIDDDCDGTVDDHCTRSVRSELFALRPVRQVTYVNACPVHRRMRCAIELIMIAMALPMRVSAPACIGLNIISHRKYQQVVQGSVGAESLVVIATRYASILRGIGCNKTGYGPRDIPTVSHGSFAY